jgi:hypothetical protein
MRLCASCFASIIPVNDELVKTVLLVGEIHVLLIHYGDKLTQMVYKIQIGVFSYIKDTK